MTMMMDDGWQSFLLPWLQARHHYNALDVGADGGEPVPVVTVVVVVVVAL